MLIVSVLVLLVAQMELGAGYEWPQALQGHDDDGYASRIVNDRPTLMERYK